VLLGCSSVRSAGYSLQPGHYSSYSLQSLPLKQNSLPQTLFINIVSDKMEEEMVETFCAHKEDKRYIKNFGWQN